MQVIFITFTLCQGVKYSIDHGDVRGVYFIVANKQGRNYYDRY